MSEDHGFFLHGRPVTKAKLARYVAERMVAEIEAAYLAPPSQAGQAASGKAADAEGDEC